MVINSENELLLKEGEALNKELATWEAKLSLTLKKQMSILKFIIQITTTVIWIYKGIEI